MSDTDQIALLHVTFWGTDFFKSKESGSEVRLGTTLEWPIFNQISTKESDTIGEYRYSARMALLALLLLMVPFCSLGTLLPTWMFLNTLQLVAHLPLLNAKLPPIVHSVLTELLTYLRLD